MNITREDIILFAIIVLGILLFGSLLIVLANKFFKDEYDPEKEHNRYKRD
jgi:hypothetical protein